VTPGPVAPASKGLVAKNDTSQYAGGETRSGLKVKIQRAGYFAVVGLDVPTTGSCSLLLARRVGRRLFYVGRVEWGATRRVVAQIRERCTIRSMPACTVSERTRGAVWIEPDLIAEVTYSGLRLARLTDPVLRAIHLRR